MVPVVLKRSGTILMPRLSYDLTSTEVASGADPGMGGPWHALGVGLGAMQVLPRGFRLSAFVQLSLASDLRDLASEDLRIGGSLLGLYQVNPQLVLGFGLVVGNSFGRLGLLPGLLVDWRPTRSLRLELSFPQHLRLSYTWADRLEVGLLSEVSGNRYTVHDGPSVGSIEHTVVDAKGYGAVRLSSRAWLSAQVGTTLYRRLAIFDGDDTETGSLSMKSGVVFRLSLEFRLPRPGAARP
jgi:hypothetical protein